MFITILSRFVQVGQEIEVRPGIVARDSEGKLSCRPILSRIVSLYAEQNDLQYAVPGGLIGEHACPEQAVIFVLWMGGIQNNCEVNNDGLKLLGFVVFCSCGCCSTFWCGFVMEEMAENACFTHQHLCRDKPAFKKSNRFNFCFLLTCNSSFFCDRKLTRNNNVCRIIIDHNCLKRNKALVVKNFSQPTLWQGLVNRLMWQAKCGRW